MYMLLFYCHVMFFDNIIVLRRAVIEGHSYGIRSSITLYERNTSENV